MSGEPIITVVGNATADPELRFTPSGAAVASFTLACTPRTYDKQSNEWRDGDTLFMRCSVWRQQAENVAESVTRGCRVVVQGKLKQREYTTKDGDKRTVIEMECDEVAPSLKYASAKVNRSQRGSDGDRQSPKSAPAEDPWGTAPPAGGGGFTEEPPFAMTPAVSEFGVRLI